jgi:hypothetical protein
MISEIFCQLFWFLLSTASAIEIKLNHFWTSNKTQKTMEVEPIYPDAFSAGLLKKPKMFYPVIDGHWWLVRNGKIIDPYFDDYDHCKKVWGCNNKQVHLPASPLVQTIIKRKFAEVDETLGINKLMVQMMFKQPTAFRCYLNTKILMEDGDELVFGSMGWHKKSGGIHYEFGGEDWTVKQFLK